MSKKEERKTEHKSQYEKVQLTLNWHRQSVDCTTVRATQPPTPCDGLLSI
jgi:hypothetical protein